MLGVSSNISIRQDQIETVLVEGSQGNGSGFRRSARMLCALQIAVNAEALAPSAVR